MKYSTLTLLFLGLLLTKVADSSELNIYMWEDTISPNVVSDWKQKNASNISFAHFDNDDERSLLMMRSAELPFDIVVLDNVSAQIYSRSGTFEDLTGLSNREHNDPTWDKACGTHAVPYFWGTVGIVYRKREVLDPPQTWSEFVKPNDAYKGHIGMIHDSVESFLPTLYSLNMDPTSEDEQDIRRAYPAIMEFSDQVLTYEYILSYIRSHPEANSVKMALAYSGDQYSLNRYSGNDDWGFVLPEGEAYLWVDCLAINSNSNNKDTAKQFLSYLMDPKVAAMNATYIKAATPNLSALKLMPSWYTNDASLFPDEERITSGQIDKELSAANISLRAKILNSILKRHEAQY